MEYIVGQRWVSHADAQLGLGVVVDFEGRRVTLAFPAVGEERTYATESAPLSRLRFKAGDRISTVDNVELLVTQVSEHHGLLVYTGTDHYEQPRTVSELELDAFIQLTTPQQRLLNGHFDKNSDFALRVATIGHLDRLQRSPARGLMGSRTSLLPHQVYIANEVGQRHAPRVLLADEVGLGKTIEAGMIIHQQLLTGRASRVLVLVPPSLLHQWLVEMLRRFNLHFSLFDADRIAELPEENPFESEQLVLCSLDLFESRPDLQAQAVAANWDLVAVDEAHHLHWSTDSAGEDYLFVEALSRASAGLLLLTATPEQIGQASHFARLRLLDPSRFHDLESFKAEEQQYRRLSELADALEAGETPADLPPGLDPLAPAETLVGQILDRHGTGRVLFRNTRAAVKGFPQRVLHRYPLAAPEEYSFARVELEEQLHPEQPYLDDSWLSFDPRVNWLEETLKKMRPAKVLVICARAETAVALEHHLQMRAGIRSAAFYEGLSIIERDRASAYFADEINGAQTLVCSEIGSEGRNFQFAHHLILFDLPLNPDLLEQRIGRLDRIGQQCDVEIHVPYLTETAQETLVDWYDRGMNLFTDSCSAGYMIFETFREQLLGQLAKRTGEFESLLAATADFTAQHPGRAARGARPPAGTQFLQTGNGRSPDRGNQGKRTGRQPRALPRRSVRSLRGGPGVSLGAGRDPAPLGAHADRALPLPARGRDNGHLQPGQGPGPRGHGIRQLGTPHDAGGNGYGAFHRAGECCHRHYQAQGSRSRHHAAGGSLHRQLRGSARAAGRPLPATVTDAPAGRCAGQGPG